VTRDGCAREHLDGNRFLGIEWHVWKTLGWLGNVVFFSRFLVQWFATEKKKQVVVPISFWWLSLIGSLLLLIYGLHQRDSVFIFAYLFTLDSLHPEHRDPLPAKKQRNDAAVPATLSRRRTRHTVIAVVGVSERLP
jgi:lipid-A-disaccharide synthase-like uncharacterized protein